MNGKVLTTLSLILLMALGCNLNNKEKVRIFVAWPGASYLPSYDWKPNEDKPTGIEPALIVRILEEAGYEYVFVKDYNHTKGDDIRIDVIEDGYADISIRSISITEARKEKVNFSEPYYYDGLSAMVVDSTIRSKNDFKGKAVFTVSFTTAYPWAKDNLPYSNIVTNEDLKMNVLPEELLLAGTIDIYIADRSYLTKSAQQNSRFRVLNEKFTNEPFGIAVHKKKKKLLEDINHALEQLKQSGELEKITAKFEK